MLIDMKTRIENIDVNLRTVSAEQAASECRNNSGILIDVRESAEVANQPVPSALHIPRGVLEMKALEQFKDASAPLYIHCASGHSSKTSSRATYKNGL